MNAPLFVVPTNQNKHTLAVALRQPNEIRQYFGLEWSWCCSSSRKFHEINQSVTKSQYSQPMKWIKWKYPIGGYQRLVDVRSSIRMSPRDRSRAYAERAASSQPTSHRRRCRMFSFQTVIYASTRTTCTNLFSWCWHANISSLSPSPSVSRALFSTSE